MLVVERCRNYALANFCDRLGDRSNPLLIFRRKKKRAQEGQCTRSQSELGFPHSLEQILRKRRHSHERRFQNLVHSS